MKKIILLFGLTFHALLSGAQILNPGFEAVTGNKPDNWNLGFYSTYFIRDTSDFYTGTKAAYIKAFGAQSYSVQGAALGLFSTTGAGNKPSALTGWYKCNLQAGDSLVFSPYLYQTTVFSPKLQAYAYTTTSTAVYKQFTAPFNYSGFPGISVDTIFVSIYLSGQSVDAESVFIPKAGTWAIIDELALVPEVVAVGINDNNGILNVEKLYPQPASVYSYLIYTVAETSPCSLRLFDVTGKEVKTVFAGEEQSPGRYKAEIDLSDLSPGVYFAQLTTGSEMRVSKVLKE